MASINVNRQGLAVGDATSYNFAQARGFAAASVNDGISSTGNVQYFSSAGRGGGVKRMMRAFLHFDTSSITTSLASAQIKVDGHVSSPDPNDSILVKSTAFGGDGGTALAVTDFVLIDFSVPYSAELTTWSTGFNYYQLTSQALVDIKTNDNFTVAIVEHDSDFANSDQGDGAYDISINFAATITLDVFTGYSNTVNGVGTANIGKINGVATGNISKVNGI
tara:strand:- start:342 stop:1004 length:663 start_codon:yes stop_codon:yes gene_type:complete